jgi:hypothetical protein
LPLRYALKRMNDSLWKEIKDLGAILSVFRSYAWIIGLLLAAVTWLSEVGGLVVGSLQPVIDLERDTFGANFKRTKTGPDPYKDYWDDMSKTDIVETVNDCVSALRAAAATATASSSAIKPVIYTNRSWWEGRIPRGTVFPNCTVWISDYRQASYANSQPRSVQGHEYHLWQFTDKAHVRVGTSLYGPYDSNKLLFGGIERLKIV